jgi:trehalose utilization protein
MAIRVRIWNEYRHEREVEEVADIYPDGIHIAIANALNGFDDFDVTTATLDDPDQGASERDLAQTDVLIWWGHAAHAEVLDATVDRVQRRILDGMGFVALHSGHHSKVFRRMMGTTCNLKWREANDKERLWVVSPSHPICSGIPEYFELEQEEMYGEHFDIPDPDELVMISWFTGGEVFRSGCCYHRGRGKVFYFRPGHETYPTYHNPTVQRVIANAVRWAAPVVDGPDPLYGLGGPNAPLEPLPPAN